MAGRALAPEVLAPDCILAPDPVYGGDVFPCCPLASRASRRTEERRVPPGSGVERTHAGQGFRRGFLAPLTAAQDSDLDM